MNTKKWAKHILQILETTFPHPAPFLQYKDPYTLLIAVLLSAQCTDVRVNKITNVLFQIADTPQKMVLLPQKTLENVIRPCGLAPSKSRWILQLSADLIAHHHGNVPASLEDLEKLPGVGRKTASVVVAQAFHIPAFPVDTHIFRCAKRWKLSTGKTRLKVEKDLKQIFPKSLWNKLHLQMIHFAKTYCPARGHKKDACPICHLV